jgi:hypothetical protein
MCETRANGCRDEYDSRDKNGTAPTKIVVQRIGEPATAQEGQTLSSEASEENRIHQREAEMYGAAFTIPTSHEFRSEFGALAESSIPNSLGKERSVTRVP